MKYAIIFIVLLILKVILWHTYSLLNLYQRRHPDKIADQISDALIDHFLAYDKNSKVACETLVTTGQVILAGEVNLKHT